MQDSQKYFDPQTISELRGLELKARTIVEGHFAGSHPSPYRGFSVEFAEHREYVPGDDLRYVDWKVFGKTDRYYLKQYEEETSFACYLVLDCSESMTYQSEQAAVSKLEYARWMAAALAWLIVHQQDAVGLVTADTEISSFLGASSRASHLNHLMHTLENTPSRGETALGSVLHELAERLPRRGVIVLLSDLFDEPEAILRGLQELRHHRHDVAVMQLIDPAEQDFPFEEPTLFHGLEGAPTQLANPRSLRAAYQEEFSRFLERVAQGIRQLKMDHVLVRTDAAPAASLAQLLRARATRSRHG